MSKRAQGSNMFSKLSPLMTGRPLTGPQLLRFSPQTRSTTLESSKPLICGLRATFQIKCSICSPNLQTLQVNSQNAEFFLQQRSRETNKKPDVLTLTQKHFLGERKKFISKQPIREGLQRKPSTGRTQVSSEVRKGGVWSKSLDVDLLYRITECLALRS